MPTTPSDDRTRALALFSVQAGPRIGDEIAVRSPVLTLGQGSQNDIVLADDSVSTTHARLEYDAGEWRITDLASTNGTSVEGVRLAPNVPTPLSYGSTVRLGGLKLHFRQVEEANPEQARAEYTPPVSPTAVAERKVGFRLPVWVFALILLVIAALFVFVFAAAVPLPAGWMEGAVSQVSGHSSTGLP
jgi:hypothetical protein